MIDLTRAFAVVERCIRKTAGLNPPSSFPFTIQTTLLRLGIDDGEDGSGLTEILKGHIADNTEIGLPSLVPPFKIDERLLTFDENSTVGDVVFQVSENAVRARPSRIRNL